MQTENMHVVSHKAIAKDTYELVLIGAMVSQMAPGQFVHVKVPSEAMLLRRPLSIAAISQDETTCTLIYRVDGAGTKALATLNEGAAVNVFGPLGSGFPLEAPSSGEALLIGGGIGVPPLYELGRRLRADGVKVTTVLGFATAEAVFYESEFAELGQVYVTTEDGSHGTKGFVTHAIEMHALNVEDIYMCGPRRMMQVVEGLYPKARGYASLEERMGCGIGACLACVCDRQEKGAGYAKVCSDGPVFPLGEVVL
ncbi:dihydroorotate oxidase B electron transfer subunit [Salsuginibacillus halophilus]|uniref:Dihydroorotate dehydrogenase B (NAD(+)), electron transfer subunit n=1 Tax=Salsuginibacillus halophilus TaxID=517424 RepID=A0A2P8HX05_9BACI|nr:dihydroorotate dehydrogenase electron transfer subunit [Salsuginibacillus halophilus]PSL50747.1 dihydroorotate oxidase B electron transfer subunit [Salsuginibacillus halophilus]